MWTNLPNLMRSLCGLPVHRPNGDISTLSGFERQLGATPKSVAPCTLPMSQMAEACLLLLDDKVVGAKDSLAARKSKLLPPMPLLKERHRCEFADSFLSAPREIPQEMADLLRSSKEALAHKGVRLSAAELLVMESMALSSFQAASWLDHWLVTVFKMLGQDVSSEMKDMLASGGKALHFLCTQATSLWSNALLKRRDAVLSGPLPLASQKALRLRDAPLTVSAPLPVSLEEIRQVEADRKTSARSSFMGNVAKPAQAAQKASSSRPSTSAGPSSSSRRRK